MRRMIAGAVLALVGAGAANAQALDYKPLDANQLVVQPADTATNIFAGTSRFLSRVVAGTIENNGFVKTFNNLLGRRADAPNTTQAGFSPLPAPGTYPSAYYKNSFVPAMPRTQIFGQTPR